MQNPLAHLSTEQLEFFAPLRADAADELRRRRNERVWVRVGDAGDYEQFIGLGFALDYLNELGVGEIDDWINDPHAVGCETPNYWGNDYISLYWGDANANLIRPLDENERILAENTLQEAYL